MSLNSKCLVLSPLSRIPPSPPPPVVPIHSDAQLRWSVARQRGRLRVRTEGRKGGGDALSIDGRKLPAPPSSRKGQCNDCVFSNTHFGLLSKSELLLLLFLCPHTLPVQWHFGASVVGRRAFFPSGDNLSFGSSFLSPPFSLTRYLLPFNPRSRGTDGPKNGPRPRRSQCGAGVSYKCSRRSEQARARGLREPPSMTFARVRVGGRLLLLSDINFEHICRGRRKTSERITADIYERPLMTVILILTDER